MGKKMKVYEVCGGTFLDLNAAKLFCTVMSGNRQLEFSAEGKVYDAHNKEYLTTIESVEKPSQKETVIKLLEDSKIKFTQNGPQITISFGVELWRSDRGKYYTPDATACRFLGAVYNRKGVNRVDWLSTLRDLMLHG